jgi:hypothetical protein
LSLRIGKLDNSKNWLRKTIHSCMAVGICLSVNIPVKVGQ